MLKSHRPANQGMILLSHTFDIFTTQIVNSTGVGVFMNSKLHRNEFCRDIVNRKRISYCIICHIKCGVSSLQQWMENIPLRVLVLLIGEVFGVRARNAWFRRRLVALLHQFVHATMGSSLNRRIIDIVQWLTSRQQVAQYLIAFR